MVIIITMLLLDSKHEVGLRIASCCRISDICTSELNSVLGRNSYLRTVVRRFLALVVKVKARQNLLTY